MRADDWSLEQALSRVPDVPPWTYYPAELDLQAARDRITRSLALRADGRGARFVVEHGGAPVGTVGLELRTEVPSVYYAFLPSGRGRGLATEAVRALAGWVLDRGAESVRASTLLGNVASERVLERAGFRRDGTESRPDGVDVTRWVRQPTHE
jgi:RimJ/RimL family protein N-acetyltransferase